MQTSVEQAKEGEALPVDLLTLGDYVADLYRPQLEPFDSKGTLAQATRHQANLVQILLQRGATGQGVKPVQRKTVAQLLVASHRVV